MVCDSCLGGITLASPRAPASSPPQRSKACTESKVYLHLTPFKDSDYPRGLAVAQRVRSASAVDPCMFLWIDGHTHSVKRDDRDSSDHTSGVNF